jgi:hypothetical protein
MKLDKNLESAIREFQSRLDSDIELDEATELTLDYLIDNDLVDLSNDDTGDGYEALHISVWEFIEELNNK